MKKLFFILLTVFALASCSSDNDEPVVNYTVTFDTNGGSPTPSNQRVEAGGTVAAPTSPTKSGYVFLFWHLNGATTAYNFQTPVNKDFTLYAKWQEEATVQYWQVTWNLNGGTWPSGDNHATQVVKGGTLAEPNAPTKADNTFDGWYKESALTNKVNFPYDVSNITANFTLYAKWTIGGSSVDPTTFTSVSALDSWLVKQPANTAETVYKVGLKNVNLDSGNNWGDLGRSIGETNKTKYVDLDLRGCTGTAIPDGRLDVQGTTFTYYGVFIACDRLLSIKFPKGLKTIGRYAFRNCKNLSSAPLPEGLLNINGGAFEYCDLSLVTLPEGLKTIGSYAFYSNEKITSITIPESVTEIGVRAFMYCESLSTVVIKANLETIDERIFSSTAIKTITIPASVKTFNATALPSSFLEEIIMLPTTPPNTSYEINEYIGGTALKRIKVPAASVEAYKNAIVWRKRADIIEAI